MRARAAVTERVERFLEEVATSSRPEAWLHLRSEATLLEGAARLDDLGEDPHRPLLGQIFAVKDNLDVAGCPTTAGCPAFSYPAETSARSVSRLETAGALVVGKTHMDQFATGLVGTRSPHGPCRNAFDPEIIAGGSSSGSAVVVALGLVDFALGTDTAGSGRVPAALNGVVGLKPTRGVVSTRGVVPACPSLDCVSIFAPSCEQAGRILEILRAVDPTDPRARAHRTLAAWNEAPRFALPPDDALEAVEPELRDVLYEAARQLEALGCKQRPIDWTPFRDAAALLYEGPWLAEREAAFGDFVSNHPAAVDPTVAALLSGAASISGADVFRGLQRLSELRHQAAHIFESIDLLVVPPVTRCLPISEVLAAPIETNAHLGQFNNFMNLLDLSGCVVPTASLPSGIPAGVTLCAPAFRDDDLVRLGARLEAERGPRPRPAAAAAATRHALVVVGAHLSGMPLHFQLEELGARLERTARTTPSYRLYSLADAEPPKPGLVRVEEGGVAVEVEVYSLSASAFARFVDGIPAPLGIGRVSLDDGTQSAGFLCESVGLSGAEDISAHGGWRSFLADVEGSGAKP